MINSNQLIINKIFRINIIVGGDHCQGVFRFAMKLSFVMKSEDIIILVRAKKQLNATLAIIRIQYVEISKLFIKLITH